MRPSSKLMKRSAADERNELRLRNTLRDRFNIQTKDNIKHIVPIFLARNLREGIKGSANIPSDHGIRLMNSGRKKKTEQEEEKGYETRLNSCPSHSRIYL
jgi:hypothetical protein